MATKRPRLFIASTTERLRYAHAIQSNLEQFCDTKVWDQGTFGVSEYPLESLMKELKETEFGAFVVAPDDLVTSRGVTRPCPRDNVLLEFGLFVGHLGRERSFLIAPRDRPDLKLPSDLVGLKPATYDEGAAEEDPRRALGAACNEVWEAAQKVVGGVGFSGVIRVLPFSECVSEFSKLIGNTSRVETSFIHSRRWRENHQEALEEFLERDRTVLSAYLPNLAKKELFAEFEGHFPDGPHIPGLVAEAYSYYSELMRRYPRKVMVRLYERYPTYSWYAFDERLLIALYPNSSKKLPVPALECTQTGSVWRFWQRDITAVRGESRRVQRGELEELSQRYRAARGRGTRRRRS